MDSTKFHGVISFPVIIPSSVEMKKFTSEKTLFERNIELKVVTSEKIGGSGVTSTLGTWYGGVVMGVLLSFDEAAILYRDFNSAPSQKQNIIVFAANNSRCCEFLVAPTILLCAPTGTTKMQENSRCYQHWQRQLFGANYALQS